MSACIYYHPEAYTTRGPKLMGRNAAGESFLRGYLECSKGPSFFIEVERPEHAKVFSETALAFGRKEPIKVIQRANLGEMAQAGTLYYPGPVIGEQAWHRAAFGHGAWSLCGITHTTSSTRAMDALTELISAPVQPWDALICTSAAVKDNATRVLRAQAEYLKERLGIKRVVLPQVPVIPLGIHTRDFAFDDATRAAARQAIGADENTMVVLFVGRLSFHGKAHPLVMYQALERAAQKAGRKLVLVECGWHANDFIKNAFADDANAVCPSVRVVTLDGREAGPRQTAWACADVFCSLSDNIQETFGIVPIEAMAAGLPVVVSDWDGYRDTVRDGVDGFRIPTLMPHAGLGRDLALRHALEVDTYDVYCGHACAVVAVDLVATEVAFEKLFASAELRRSMGAAGRQRAREIFDWSVIIPAYEELWASLAELRRADAKDLKPGPRPWPGRLDPFETFVSYPSAILTRSTRLALVDTDAPSAIARVHSYKKLAMVGYAWVVIPEDAEIEQVLRAAEAGPCSAAQLIAAIPAQRQAFVLRSLAWLVKLGVLRHLPSD